MARLGMARRGWQGEAGKARRGMAGRGMAGLGMARRGWQGEAGMVKTLFNRAVELSIERSRSWRVRLRIAHVQDN